MLQNAPTQDAQQTAEFYRDRLSFDIDFIFGKPADHATVSRGEGWSNGDPSTHSSTQRSAARPTHTRYIYIVTDTSLDTPYESLREKRTQIEHEPTAYPWGMREFVIRNLNQYRLVFSTHI